ncbi:MAG: hypothetical protein ACRDRC_07160, partial [Pseudonocardiaceae bacterium]
MPEYLTPGVYIEETSFRSRSIEGVPTSTFGMAGLTRYGPVPYVVPRPNPLPPVVMVSRPTLITSLTEFERAFGGLDLVGAAGLEDRVNYLGYAARAFFDNGGRRLYVSRVFPFTVDASGAIDFTKNFASLPVGAPPAATWRARWPGEAGNEISVQVGFVRSKNVIIGGVLTGVTPGAAVEVGTAPATPPKDTDLPKVPDIRIVAKNPTGKLGFQGPGGAFVEVGATAAAFHITLTVSVRLGQDRLDTYSGLELHADHPRSVSRVLQAEQPTDEFSLVWLDMPAAATPAVLGQL